MALHSEAYICGPLVGSCCLKHLNEDIQNSAYPDLLVDFGRDQIATQFVCGGGWLLRDVDYSKDIISPSTQTV